jgi:hypothetical protein
VESIPRRRCGEARSGRGGTHASGAAEASGRKARGRQEGARRAGGRQRRQGRGVGDGELGQPAGVLEGFAVVGGERRE